MPNRIDLDCNVNAAASFRHGFGSMLKNDLVLTIWVPLIAGVNLQQLAGIVAHEFGHFTQGFGMRLTYIIRSINFWFGRVIYERDAWDLWLEETGEEAEDWWWAVIVGCARFSIWFSRQILKAIMYAGHFLSSFLLRQMEYDADSYEIQMAGSGAFENTFQRLHVLEFLLKPVYKEIRVSWNNSHELPDDFSAMLMKHDALLDATHRTRLEDTLGLQASGLFDTHPSTGDRIRCARQKACPGIFHKQAPATSRFSNFEILSKQVTQLHYADDLGLETMAAKLVPVRKEKVPLEIPAASLTEIQTAYQGALRLQK